MFTLFEAIYDNYNNVSWPKELTLKKILSNVFTLPEAIFDDYDLW